MNIGYFRVSMEGETIQDLDRQIEVVLEKFKIDPKEIKIYKERGSAYDLNKISKRKEFLHMLEHIFHSDIVTINDLFKRNVSTQHIDLYIYHYSRIMRNIEFSFLFSILCCLSNVTIHSFKDGLFKIEDNMTPTTKLVKYMELAIKAYSGEEYSYNTSVNIKKSRKVVKGMSLSSYGKKWGGQLRYLDHTKEDPHFADVETVRKIEKYIRSLIKDYSYPIIINKVVAKYNIKISKGYITKVSRR